jgi:hypothetical protein
MNGDRRSPLAADARPVSPKALAGGGLENVATHRRPAAPAHRDERGAVGPGGVHVVHHDGAPSRQCLLDQRQLARLLVAPVAQKILAHVRVCRGEALVEERRLACTRQPDEDHELGHPPRG